MKRVYSKVMGVICMAAAVFSVATGSVNVSAAGLYNLTSQAKVQPAASTSGKTLLSTEKTTLSKNSYLTSEQESIMNKLDTDYNKVNWGVQYSPKDMEGIVISVASYKHSDSPYLLIGITNIYDEDVTFSAKGYAKGKSGQEVADISFYETAIRPGNTIVQSVYCDNTPTGEIHWDSIELPNVYETSTYWEGDWYLSTDSDGYYKVDYTVKSDDYMMPGYVTALLLDSTGNIIDAGYDYSTDKGYTLSDRIQFYEKDYNRKVVDVAMFTNPLIHD